MPRLTLLLGFSVQPYSIGDTLVALSGAMAVADERGLEGIDVLAVADPRVEHADPNMAERHRSPLDSLGVLLPLLELGGVETVLVTTDAAAPFVGNCWPPVGRYVTYEAHEKIAAYHKRHGHTPRLQFSPERCAWADMFLGKCGKRVITVNLRQNYAHHPHRNYSPGIWAEAMDVANERWGVRFCVVGEPHEASAMLRGRATITKDRRTSLLDDLSLIHRSKAHIGSPSGPAMVATLGSAPYFIVAADMKPHLSLYGGALKEDKNGDLVYSYASPGQRWSPQPESVPLLVEAIGDLVRRAWP